MRILIVDDSIDKISDLSSLIYHVFPEALIETAENIFNALELLKKNNYNLAVIDLLLPLRKGEFPKEDGGKFLLDEVYRKEVFKVPNFIIGFTQHKEHEDNFSTIWSTIVYEPKIDTWKDNMSRLLHHIKSTNFKVETEEKFLPKIFVEGLTDKYYLEESIGLYFKDELLRYSVDSQKNAGANWVANQIPIWAMRLQRTKEGDYVKAIGLLDSDEAGNIAKEKIENRNLSANEQKCFSIIQLKPSYNNDILEFYQNGIRMEIEIESLFPLEVLKYAEGKGWLEFRTPICLTPPKNWNQIEETLSQYLTKIGILEDKQIYLKKVKLVCKEKFQKYVQTLENKSEVYSNFQPLLSDIFEIS